MPTVDELLGPAPAAPPGSGGEGPNITPPPNAGGMPAHLPTVDDVLGPEPDAGPHPAIGDYYFSPESALLKTGFNAPRILSAFGQGAESGWGSEPLGLGQETQDWLKKIGIFNDYRKGQSSIIKSLNEAVMRPAAVAADLLFNRLPMAAYRGAQEAILERARETGNPNVERLARDVASVPEAFMGTPNPLGVPAINEARDLSVIGQGEDGWKGTAPSELAEAAPAQDAVRAALEEAKSQAPAIASETPPVAAPEAIPALPSIDDVARQIDPQTFQVYDALADKKAIYMRWLGDLRDTQREEAQANAPHAEEIADLQQRLDLGTTPRLAKKYQARLADLTPAHDDFIQEAISRDSPDMQRVRQALMAADYKMRDLAPQVSDAYRQAREQIGPEPEAAAPAPEAPASEAATIAVPEPATRLAPSAAPVAPALIEEAAGPPMTAEPVNASSEAPSPVAAAPAAGHGAAVSDIGTDASRQLQAAGRPPEEAEATGQIIAAHYRARAARFGGANGTAEQLYTREGPQIRAGRGAAAPELEFAQPAREEDRQSFASDLARSRHGELGGTTLRLGGTPLPLQALGVAPRPLRLSPSILAKIEGKHGLSENVVARLPDLLSEPAFVLNSATKDGRFVVGLNAKDQRGNPVLAVVHPQTGAAAHHAIASIYGKERAQAWLQREIAAGRLRYLDKKSAAAWTGQPGLQLPTGAQATAGMKVLSRVDIFKGPEFRQGARGKVSIREGRAIITLFKTADASTFIHETGHMWLEELISDAADERAPADLVADASTVRKWLGAEEGKPIARRQHEKFARGFERYMMEGRAPTVALTKVFAKFKEWLTAIYRSVSNLRSPINDQIRGVFDRMLAEPERPVITGREAEAESSFADIHEEIAEHTPREHAAPVGDRVRTERDMEGIRTAPELEDERLGGRASEAGRGEEGNRNPDGGRAEGQFDAGAEGGLPEAGAVGAGRGEAPAQGNRSRSATEPPRGPNEPFTAPDSGLIDKAGNIRLDNLNTPEDVGEVIREAANQNEGFIGARRGVISDAQVLDLADALGMDAADLSKRKLGQAFNAEQIMAARKLLIQSATAVRDAMTKAAEGSGADLAAYAEVKARHLMIQEQVSGITAEAGRALRAFRNMGGASDIRDLSEFLQSATGTTPEQLRMEAVLGKKLLTPQQISKYVRDSAKPGFGDMVLEYWINALISGPATHTTYSIGNALLALWKAGPETSAAAAIGALRRALGDEGPRVFAGEVPAQLYGMMHGVPNGIVAAWEALKSGRTTLLPGEEAAMTARDLAMSPLVNPRAAIPDFRVAGIPVPLGTFIRLPSRAIAVIHSFFRAVNYEREITGLAYRQAAEEGLAGEGIAAKLNAAASRIGEIAQNPSSDLMRQARASATDLTLMGRGGELTQALSRLTNAKFLGFRWLKFVDPFVHISSNVIEQAILRRTPIGVLVPEIRADLMGANGAIARDTAIARMAVGSALAVGVGSLAAKGLVNGSGPSNPREASLYAMVNGPPDSVKIGDIWYTTQRLGVLGMQISIAADLYGVAHEIGKDDSLTIAHNLVHSFTQTILNESFMRGPAELIQALTDPDRYGRNYVKNFLASFVPFSVGLAQAARAVDPYSRNARTLLDAIKNKIPWLSTTLLPRRDIWGEPIPNKEALGAAGLTAIYETRIKNDPVNQQLLSLGIFPAMPERRIRGVMLTDQQYDDYARIAGRMAKARLDAMVSMPGFTAIPPDARREMMVETIVHAREAARSLVMMRSIGNANDIVGQALAVKQAPLKGKVTQ